MLFFLFLFLMDSVSAETKTVMEGDSVTLHTNLTEIRNADTILWLFGPKDSVISQITRQRDLNSIYFTDDVRFRGRLQVDQNTGSLTIRNTRIRHAGQYKLSISREKTTIKIFNVTVFGVVGKTDEVKSVSVKEGKSITLKTDSDIHPDDLIVWWFGDKGILLAKIDVETNETSLNDADERFRDRLKLDQTGSLIITNTRTEHTGLYELQIRGSESSQRFLLSVNAVADAGLSPGGIAGIAVAVLLVLVVVVIYYRCTISKLKQQVAEKKSVAKAENVPLETGVENIQTGDLILWTFGAKNCLIAKADSETVYITERFKDNLKLDPQTGSLTIKNTTDTEYGHYKLQIINQGQTTFKRFIVLEPAEPKSVAEGKDVTLKVKADVKIQKGDLILWMFGAKNCLVAKAYSSPTDISERFRHNLELDKTTGSLTIRNITSADYGHYKLQIINQDQTTFRRFNVTLKDDQGQQANENTALLTREKNHDVLVLQNISD